MFYGCKGNSITIDGTTMDYVEFGYGKTPLVILPGLVDGLKTVKGQSLNLAFYFREFSKDFKVYIFSRKEKLNSGYTTRDMAKDLKIALDQLGLEKVCLMGVSQGGMIAQYFAIDNPDMVEKLLIVVSSSRANDTICNAINKWIKYAENGDYKSLIIDTLEKTYSVKKLKYYKFAYPIISRIGKPKDFSRFLIQANAVLTHNAYSELEKIICPTLIVEGDSDKIVGSKASMEMSEKIPNNTLISYEGLGHAAYEEAKDFNKQAIHFLLK